MHHLLLGIDPVELGQAPFALATSDSVTIDARDLGLAGVTPPRGSTCCPASRAMWAPTPPPWRCRRRPARRPRTGPDRRCRHQCRDPAGRHRGRAGLFLAHRPRLRGRADQLRPARRPRRHRTGRDRPGTKEPRFKVIGCDLWSDDPGLPRPRRIPASPASAARASSRRWPRCAWRACSTPRADRLGRGRPAPPLRTHGPHPRLPPA
jgi:hypothetical protein